VVLGLGFSVLGLTRTRNWKKSLKQEKLKAEIAEKEKEDKLWREKAQEQSLKLGQFYTPECLVELCLELLKPTGELFDPCCGLGSFLLKAKAKDNDLKISGNDIAKDLGELSFEFTNSDYLNSEDKQFDYIIANIPFNLKKTHCQLVDENYCWIEKIIKNTRKKALIILPSGVNSGLNKKITEKRIQIINSGVLELVLQLPNHLFNQTGIAPTIWLINKEKTEKNVCLLTAEKFSEWKDKKRTLTEENIKQICDKNNWIKADLAQIEENNFCLAPQRFEPSDEREKPMWEINQQLIKCSYELRYSLHAIIADAYQKLMMLEELDDSGEIKLQNCFIEAQKITELQKKIAGLLLEKHFK
jgi:type I restriction-modification system DNA methylase subunit